MSEAPEAVDVGETSPPRRRRRALSVLRAGLFAIGWLVVAVLGLVALLRLVAWDAFQPLVVVDALTLVIYLPAWVVAVGALIAQRWRLAAAAAVIVAVQLVFVAPEFAAAAPMPAWARHAPVIRLFDANVDKSLRFQAGYVRAIEQDRPDLITLEEFTPSALKSMIASGVLATYRYRCVAPAYGATGFLIASRLRLTGCQVHSVPIDGQQVPYLVQATLYVPGGPLAVRVVHTLAPFPAYWREWAAALAAVGRSVRASGDTRMLMVGDFNATWGNRGFAALLHDGLTDGAAARGKAVDMTWPNGAIVPPFVRIDHVLTGARLAVTQIAARSGFGSDHRYLTATIAIRTLSSGRVGCLILQRHLREGIASSLVGIGGLGAGVARRQRDQDLVVVQPGLALGLLEALFRYASGSPRSPNSLGAVAVLGAVEAPPAGQARLPDRAD
jgi:endonuclease/exonuclease/phosphatase (EEP) superfamily protein YafD